MSFQEFYQERTRQFTARGWTICGGSWLSGFGMVATVKTRHNPDRPIYPVHWQGRQVGFAQLQQISADRLGALVYWNPDAPGLSALIESLRRHGPGPKTVTLDATEFEIRGVVITPGGWKEQRPQDVPRCQTSRELK